MKVVEIEFRYLRGKPVMCLRRAVNDEGIRSVISLDSLLWKYSDTHNDDFDHYIAGCVKRICERLKIDLPKGHDLLVQLQISIADTIMGGIDELVKMPPFIEGMTDPKLEIEKRIVETEENSPIIRVRMQ